MTPDISSNITSHPRNEDKLALEDLENQNPVIQPSVNCWGRTFKDWTQYPLTAVGLGFFGGAGYAFYSSNYIFGGILAAGGITSFISCFRIRQFKPQKKLENRIQELGRTNQSLHQNVDRLTSNIEKLQRIKDDLSHSLKKSKEQIDDLKSNLNSKTKDLTKVVDKLKIAETNLAELKKTYELFKKKTEGLVAEIASFNQKNEEFRKQTQQLSDVVESVDEQAKKIEEGVSSFDSENDEMLQQNQELGDLIGKLQGELSVLKGDFEAVKQSLLELAKNVNILDETDDKFLTGANKLEEVNSDLSRILKGFSDFLSSSGSDDS